MGVWMLGSSSWFNVGSPPVTSCLIGSDSAYDHAWPMWVHFGIYEDYNNGCHSAMVHLDCGQFQTKVYSSVTATQINYVRTVDGGPCLNHPACSPNLCNYTSPKMLIDLTPGAFQALGVPLSQGIQPVFVWQP